MGLFATRSICCKHVGAAQRLRQRMLTYAGWRGENMRLGNPFKKENRNQAPANISNDEVI
jgi:hypothetical protein